MRTSLGILQRVSAFSIRYPRSVLTVWILCTAALAAIGGSVAKYLHDTDFIIEGTPSAKAIGLEEAEFGKNFGMVVMLKGPKRALDRQGPVLANRIDRISRVKVISPWARGAPKSLRRKADRALLMVQAQREFEDSTEITLPAVRSEIRRTIKEPVESHISGTPPIAEAMINEGYGAAARAEKLAAPMVLIVLLLVFRSPIAAALPALLGFAIIASGRGLLVLAGSTMLLDTLALSLMSMLGLALGVDYSLLLVSRFREEVRAGQPTAEAARVALGTSGRTVFFAGMVLILAMVAASVIAPGTILVSAAVGMIGATLLSLVAALTVLPAALVLLGPNVDRWRFGRRSPAGGAAAGLARRAIRSPTIVAAVVLIPLLATALPASALSLGVPSIENLPKDNLARKDFEAIRDAYGPGWTLPFEILAVSRNGPITSPERLRALSRFERKLAARRDVEAVVGPGVLSRPAKTARSSAERLGKSRQGIDKLGGGLARSSSGVRKLRTGLGEAAGGSERLAEGSRASAAGAAKLSGGLSRSLGGLDELSAGLSKTEGGSTRLQDALGKTHKGAAKLSVAARDAAEAGSELARPARRLAQGMSASQGQMAELRDASSDADSRLARAMDSLDAMSLAAKSDPQYRNVLEQVATARAIISGVDPTTGVQVKQSYKGMAASMSTAIGQSAEAANGTKRLAQGVERLKRGLVKLSRATAKLDRGTGRTLSASRRLGSGLGRLSKGGKEAQGGTAKLARGARQLQSGVGRLSSASDRLRRGLSSGAGNTAKLGQGLSRMESGVKAMAKRGGSGSNDAQAALKSGYFVLAGLDTRSAAERQSSNYIVNLDRGGEAARITVVPGKGALDGASDNISPDLDRMRKELGRDLGAETALAGRAAVFRDYRDGAKERRWPLVGLLLGVTFLLLVVVFRSLLLALKAAVLNLLTVGVAFGVLTLAFQGSSPPLGGPGYIDIIAFYGIYTVVFALSLDYEVFLISRMREGYLVTGSNRGAITYGIDRTAGIITGAALIMAAVFIAFALSGIGELMQFGIGLTVAVIVDASVVRLLLLPATMRLLGKANWWLPRWLDRILPQVDLEGMQRAPRRRAQAAPDLEAA